MNPGQGRTSSAASREARAETLRRGNGFSLIELLVVILILAILLGILLPVVSKVRASAKSVNCLANLRQIATAFHHYAQDNEDRLPDPTASDLSWETALQKYLLGAGVFTCPADIELVESVGSSYDWRDTGHPATTLAGQVLSEVRDEGVVLVFDAMPNWHVKRTMNVARLDGSAVTMDERACLADLTRPLRTLTPEAKGKKDK